MVMMTSVSALWNHDQDYEYMLMHIGWIWIGRPHIVFTS